MRALALVFFVFLGGCEDCRGPEAVPVSAPADAARADAKLGVAVADAGPLLPPRTAPRAEISTVPGPVFLEGLDKTIATAKGAELAKARQDHARVTGDVEELVQALAAIDPAIAEDARVAIHPITRARILLDLGRVDDARASLAKAKELGATPQELDAAQADVDWASGRFVPASEAIRRIAKETPSVATLLRRARLAHDTGDEVDSDRSLDAAEDLARDPLELTDVYAQRGFAKLDIGKADEARVWFEAAERRLKSTRARRGLAESLDALGKKDEAIAQLDEESKDLDLLVTLARLSPPARPKARTRLGVLLTKAPEAVLPEAAAFYLRLDPEPKRAVELATRAVKASPTAANHALLARAQLESGDAAAARTSIEAALRVPVASARIDWTAARIYARLGEAGKADELAARARRRDPRIESSEPALKK